MARKPSDILGANLTEINRQLELIDRAIGEHTRNRIALIALRDELTDTVTASKINEAK